MPSTVWATWASFVQGLLDAVGDVLPAQHLLGRVLGGEVVQLGADPAMELVAFVLQVDGGQVDAEAVGVHLLQAAHALAGVSAARSRTRACSVTGSRDSVMPCRKTMSQTSSMAR